MKQSNISGPTPQPVREAIKIITAYINEGGWEQAIISKEGGASFSFDNVYEIILGKEAFESVREAGRKAFTNG